MDDLGATKASTTREGFRVIGVAVRREPGIFVLSSIGSLIFGALTVADAWVLGWATDHVVLPAFRTGHVGAGLLWAVLGLFVGVAILRAVGIVARRLGAGIMQYRMQAHSRRAVTRQYLDLPMSGTSATRPASCSPTPTPTSRPPGRPSRRCRWRSAPS